MSLSIFKKSKDLVALFSKDTGMKFGQDKYAYIKKEKAKNTTTKPIQMNGLKNKSIQEGESYRYLDQQENVEQFNDGQFNKERVLKEYLSQVTKIWSSEVSAFNKTIAYNTFATPVLMPTIRILD